MHPVPTANRIAGACLVSALIWGYVAYPQTASLPCLQNTQDSPARLDWTNAANRWRLTPADVSGEGDRISPVVRAARNSFFFSLLNDKPDGVGFRQYDSTRPDVSPSTEDLQRVWVVGAFESSRVYSADNSNHFLYTEINVRVETILRRPDTSAVTVGSTIDVYLLGGPLRTADGNVHSSRLSPEKYSLEPGRRYILALAPEPAGLFVEIKGWDVTEGVVKTSSLSDEARVRKGQSELVGLPLAGAIKHIKNALSSE